MRCKQTFITSLLLLLCTQAWALSDEARIRELLSGMTVKSIKASPVTGWYEVETPETIVYVDKGARYALFGHLYDLVTHQDLTKKSMPVADKKEEAPHILWSELPTQSAILNGRQHPTQLAVFLDPECPYCRQLMKDLKTTHYSIAYYLMPLDELHPDASYKSQQILCSPMPYATLVRMLADNDTIESPSCHTSALDNVQQFAKQHDFYGTPVLIRRDGTMHLGYLSPTELDAWLKAGVSQ